MMTVVRGAIELVVTAPFVVTTVAAIGIVLLLPFSPTWPLEAAIVDAATEASATFTDAQ